MKKRAIRRKAGKQNFLSGLVVIMQLVLCITDTHQYCLFVLNESSPN